MSNTPISHSPLSTNDQVTSDQQRVTYFNEGLGDLDAKLRSLSRFMSRQYIAKHTAYSNLFERTQGVLGSILECGVYFGNGLMTYANLSAALEPYNYQCKILGFDTFEGDAGVSKNDRSNELFTRKDGDYAANSYDDLMRAIKIFDSDRPLNHLSKVELIKGDLRNTAPEYLQKHPSLLVRILHLSVNLYEPTRACLETFLPRVPKGGIIAIHGLNYTAEGATSALSETLGGKFSTYKLEVFDFYPNMTFFQI